MEQNSTPAPCDAGGRFAWRVDRSLVRLGLLSALVIGGGGVTRFIAVRVQTPEVHPLTVRPREMATGTRTARAGVHLLPGFPDRGPNPPGDMVLQDFSVYVPEQCVGTRRCPLLVNLLQGGEWRPAADKYGMIMLVIYDPLVKGSIGDSGATLLDSALKKTLRQFAIDPDRIAIVGQCASGGQAFFWGRSNLHVFSRIALTSPASYFAVTTPPQNKKAQFLMVVGIDEQTGFENGDPYLNYYLRNSMRFARAARRDGLYVTDVLGLRNHLGRGVDYDLIGRWFAESWAKPARPRPAPIVIADPLPVLTPRALTQLTAFWTHFVQEPDSILVVARQAHLRQVFVPVGTTRLTVWMSDLPALARKYPSVAADLRVAGLTAQQAEAYRVALISTRAILEVGSEAGTIAGSSVSGQNIAFFRAHPKELEALSATNMWITP